ncbi:hypothetical protein CMU91_14875 [Elizabethkingia anophelis]|nr:hypothetical protein [Elizabethkingia anophelis]
MSGSDFFGGSLPPNYSQFLQIEEEKENSKNIIDTEDYNSAVNSLELKISQSLIKEVLKTDHCPKQVYYSFIMGKELIDPSEVMLLGRYFESELLGACRGGDIQEAKYLETSLKPKTTDVKEVKLRYVKEKGGYNASDKNHKELDEIIRNLPKDVIKVKAKPYEDCDALIEFAKNTLLSIGLDISKGKSQVEVISETLSGNIDHENFDLINPLLKANYDAKYTETVETDRWNGWGDPESKEDAEIQAAHYSILCLEAFGEIRPFYFLVFGKTKWVKILRFDLTEDTLNKHRARIYHTALKIREYSENNYKGNGNFNKCNKCPFNDICEDRKMIPEIEIVNI